MFPSVKIRYSRVSEIYCGINDVSIKIIII